MSAIMTQEPKHPLAVLRGQLRAHLDDLRNMLPKNMDAEHFIEIFLSACSRTPELYTVDRQSLYEACKRAAADGCLPDGREAVILPYRTKQKDGSFRNIAQYQIMVAGLLKRFRNSGLFRSVDTNVVRAGELFEYFIDERGPHFKHVPGDGEGPPIKAYAMATTKDNGVMIKVMSVADIEKRRAVSKAKDGAMWTQWWNEAAEKTCLRSLAKRLPMSSDLDDLIRRDDDLNDFKPTAADTPAATAPPMTRSTITNVVEALERFGSADDDPTAYQYSGPLTEGAEYGDSALPELSAKEYEAYEKGREAKRNGHLRKAVPGEYRSVEMSHLAKLWWQGWDDEAENRPWSREQAKP